MLLIYKLCWPASYHMEDDAIFEHIIQVFLATADVVVEDVSAHKITCVASVSATLYHQALTFDGTGARWWKCKCLLKLCLRVQYCM